MNTPPTNPTPDVLIIGGGVIGLAAAYALLKRGAAVTVVEQHDVGAGSSWGNAGWIVPSYSVPLASPHALGDGLRWMRDPTSPFYIRPRWEPALWAWLARFVWASRPAQMARGIPVLRDLGQASQSLLETWIAQEGWACGYQRRGVLTLYLTEEASRAGEAEARLLRQYGIAAEMLDRQAVLARVPQAEPAVGGLLTPNDAHLDPSALLQALATSVRALGGRILTQTRVQGFRFQGPRVAAVLAGEKQFRPQHIVLAAGAWSADVGKMLGLRLPIQAAKGYSLTFEHPPTLPPMPLMLGESKVAVTPLPNGRLRLAGTLELAGLSTDINARRVAALLTAARRYLGMDLSHLPQPQPWAGLRPCTPDGLPIIGRAPGLQNVFLATGHCMLGVSLAAVTGELVAQQISGEPTTLPLPPLRAARF